MNATAHSSYLDSSSTLSSPSHHVLLGGFALVGHHHSSLAVVETVAPPARVLAHDVHGLLQVVGGVGNQHDVVGEQQALPVCAAASAARLVMMRCRGSYRVSSGSAWLTDW